jgi:hypothetical protein
MARRLFAILFCVSFAILGCQREGKKNSSSISIVVPPAANSHNKTGGIGSMSTMPSDRKACYGVIISGPGLTPQPANACSPPAAIRAGFVEPGATIEISVPKGSNRTVELFAFLQASGLDQPCPAFNPSLSAAQIAATYKLDSVSSIDMSGEVTRVTLNANFPGVANNYAVAMGLPATCTADSASPGNPNFSISNGRGVASNGAITLYGAVGRPVSGMSASNGAMTLKKRQ